MAGSCEHSNEPSGSIKGEEFLDKLDDVLVSEKGLYCMLVGCVHRNNLSD